VSATYLAVDCLGDGLEATTLLKGDATRAIAVIALTARVSR
jgi:CheY-like chemotaxis protein